MHQNTVRPCGLKKFVRASSVGRGGCGGDMCILLSVCFSGAWGL